MSLAFREGLRGSLRDNDIDLEPDEFGRGLGGELAEFCPPAILDRDRAILDPAEFAQALHKSGSPFAGGQTRALAQKPDGRQLTRLLRAGRERPYGRRAAEQRDELAALHSITSSARPDNGSGIVSPSVLAVLRLMTSSIFTTCWTGRSAGSAPLRILPV
jgi:hypothetical protein